MPENGPNPETAIAVAPKPVYPRVKSETPIWDSDSFEHAQRVATILAKSLLVPAHLRGAEHIPDLVLLCLMAQARNEHPLALAQHVYFVAGRAGYAASYLIAQANRSGGFRGPIRWRESGAGDALVVEAFACLPSGEEISATTSMAMARAEGWTKNPKYQSMPQQMLRYRAATMLIRLYCPEVIMASGPAVEEIDVPEPEPDPDTKGGARDRVRARLALPPQTIDLPGTEAREVAPAPAPQPPPAAEPAPQSPEEQERRSRLSVLRTLWETDRPACEAAGQTTMRGIAGASLDAINERIERIREQQSARALAARGADRAQEDAEITRRGIAATAAAVRQGPPPPRQREPGDDDEELPFGNE